MKQTHNAALLALCAVALNLRPALSAIGPVLEPLRADLQLSYGAAGVLTALPVLCMGLFASLTPRWQARFGLNRGIMLATALIGIATALRIFPSYAVLLISSLLTGAAIAVLGPLLNAYVKHRFADDGARVTSWVTTALCLGAALAAGSTAALAEHIGWRYALGAWCVLAVIAIAYWRLAVGDTAPNTSMQHAALPWHDAKAWQLMLTFGLHSMVFYALLAWIAPVYRDAGLSAAHAGHLLGVFAITQIIGTLAVSALPRKSRDRRPAMLAFGAMTLSGLLLLWHAPLAAPYAAMSLLGAGTAGLFVLTLILPLDYSASPAEAGAWTAMMCGGGYMLAALGPWAVGKVRDISGDYHQVFLLLMTASAVVFISLFGLGPRRAHTA